MVAEQMIFDLPAHHHLLLLLLLQMLPQCFLRLKKQAASPAPDLCSNYTTSSGARFKNVWKLLEALGAGGQNGKTVVCVGGGGGHF